MRWMVAGAGLALLAAALAWQVGAQARDGAATFPDRASAMPASTGFVGVRPAASPASHASAASAASAPSDTAVVMLPPKANRGASAATAVPAPPVAPASDALDNTLVDPTLLLRTVSLRAGRRGEAYRPLSLVRQDAHVDPVRLTGELPPGLSLGDDGNLRGTPTRVGLFSFQLEVVDKASAQTLARQRYALRVLAPAPVHPATSAPIPASAARPTLKTLSEDDSAAFVDVDKAVPASYMLTSIAAWVPTEDAAKPGSDAASGVVVPAADGDAATEATAPVTAVEAARLPTIDQLRAQLKPLVDIEYPTRPLFVQALQASHCDYYRAHLVDLAKDKSVDMTCPPPPPTAASANKNPGDPMTLSQFYQSLLPARIEKEVVDAALRLHPVTDTTPLALGSNGCGCHVQEKDDENVYGLFPFWLATKQTQTVDFNLFSHIGFMGAVLQDNGSLSIPGGSTPRSVRFARVAVQHETAVDLVVYRRDWATLLRLKQADLDTFTQTAARATVEAADLRFDDATSRWLQPLLMPGWREKGRVYAGITIFFDDSSVEPGQRKAFKDFYRRFAQALIVAMQHDGNSYHLNFVVPDAELGDEEGAYGFAQLEDYMEQAQKEPRDKNADEATKRLYKGTTDISVFYLVTLGVPTSTSRLDLRSLVDHTNMLHGHRRVAFLQGVVPMLFGTRARDDQPIPHDREAAISSDLAYMRWNYGGAGFWPAPIVLTSGPDSMHKLLESNYSPHEAITTLCQLACPNRIVLRLLFQLAMLLELVALVAYGWSCRMRQSGGRQLLLLLLVGAFATFALGGIEFTCDPALDSPNKSNWAFGVSLALAGLWAVYKTLRPTMDPP